MVALTRLKGTDSSDKNVEVEVKKKTKGETLQSPFDPDASYGHKGRGYSTHITETCNNEGKPEIITDYEAHGAARSDMGKTPDVLDRLASAELMPEVLFEDGGYPTVPSTIEILDRPVERNCELIQSRQIQNTVFAFMAENILSKEPYVYGIKST